MLLKVASSICTFSRKLSGRSSKFNVAIVGASGGIGQPFSLLMKLDPLVCSLSLHDLSPAKGVATDLSHIETEVDVCAYTGLDQLKDAIKDMDIVMIPAGLPRKPGMSRDDLFSANAGIVKALAEAVAEVCPKALVGIITNPVNTVVPIMCEILKKKGKLDPNRIFGITTLDLVRANTMIAEAKCLDPNKISVPVIGGHSGVTIIPLISKNSANAKFTDEEIAALTKRIQNAGTEVVEAKEGKGSATLSMAYAAARFTNSLLRGLKGESNVCEAAYVMSDVTESPYFSTALTLGKEGISKRAPVDKNLTPFEQELLKKAIPELKKNIETGVKYVEKLYGK